MESFLLWKSVKNNLRSKPYNFYNQNHTISKIETIQFQTKSFFSLKTHPKSATPKILAKPFYDVECGRDKLCR